MLEMTPGEEIMAGQLAGDFTLPRDKKKKLVFIAGGIGVTPFRSMVKYLSDRGEKRSVVLLYSNRTTAEIAYRDIFDEAARTIGLKTIYAITGAGETPPKKTAIKDILTAHSSAARSPIIATGYFIFPEPRDGLRHGNHAPTWVSPEADKNRFLPWILKIGCLILD